MRGFSRAQSPCVLMLFCFLLLTGPWPGPETACSADAVLPGAHVPPVPGDPGGTGISGDAWTVGPGLATAANQAAAMNQTAAAAEALLTQIAALNAALQSRLAGGSSAAAALAEGGARELTGALERLAGVLSADLEALQHNPLSTGPDCADLGAAMANLLQSRTRAVMDRLQEESLDETRRDGRAGNFPQAQGLQDVALLDSELLRDEPVFRPGWILPADGLIRDPAKTGYMIGVLSNPVPSPGVSEEAARTPGGRRGASALKVKSALTGLSEGALRFVSQFFLPLPEYAQVVPELQEEAGVAEEDRMPGDEGGHSLMQYLTARQQRLSGSVNRLRNSVLWNQSDSLRAIAGILAESYQLELERLKAELHQTALLAALAGARSRELQREAERHLVPLRQERGTDPDRQS